MASGQEDPYIPVLAIGPVLKKLSQNISISFLSQPKPDTTTTMETTCTTYETIAVLEVQAYDSRHGISRAPCAVGAATVSLVLGGHAFLAAGIAHDRSFSSVVRSTGDRDLDVLCAEDEGNAALPLAPELQERQFRFPGDGIAHATKMMQPRRG